jgi:hypothetical protein
MDNINGRQWKIIFAAQMYFVAEEVDSTHEEQAKIRRPRRTLLGSLLSANPDGMPEPFNRRYSC